MSATTPVADGSAAADAHRPVEIDRDAEPWRWRCPNGHTTWDRTNSHAHCTACRRQEEAGVDVDPEHWEIYDARRDELVPFAALVFAD